MANIKKAQTGAGVPKGMVRGERSEGTLYKKADADKWGKGMSDAMDRQAGLGKYAPKKNDAINNKPLGQQMTSNMLKRDAKVANYLKEKEKNSYSNERANKVVGKKPMKSGGKMKKK